MITIFNGRRRTLGGSESSVWAQIDVSFREHLADFKGARLGVFLAIALHANEEGWAWPSYKTLEAETGYEKNTIARALADLCGIRINGQRVLLRYQPMKASGEFDSNRYLLFPSEADVKLYDEAEQPCPQNADTVNGQPCPHFAYTVNADTNNNQSEPEPKEGEETSAIWRKALSLLALRMAPDTFNNLFLSSRLKADGEAWVVELVNEGAHQWAEARMADVVAEAIRGAGGGDRPVVFATRRAVT